MATAQSGIFALGTSSHGYLELNRAKGVRGEAIFLGGERCRDCPLPGERHQHKEYLRPARAWPLPVEGHGAAPCAVLSCHPQAAGHRLRQAVRY